MDMLKFFAKLWLYFICVAICVGLVVWGTILVAHYSVALAIVVLIVGIGGIFAGMFAFALR